MRAMSGERERLITNAIELRRRLVAVVEDMDYWDRTEATADSRMRVVSDRLSRIVDGLDEHLDGLESLVDEGPAAGRLPATQVQHFRRG